MAAYGHDSMSVETMLHGEGLLHDVMHAPAVSRAQMYKELCLAAYNKEKRLAELRKRRQPAKDNSKSQRDKRKDSKPTSAPTQVTNFRSKPRKGWSHGA